jgi:hypothetical protein
MSKQQKNFQELYQEVYDRYCTEDEVTLTSIEVSELIDKDPTVVGSIIGAVNVEYVERIEPHPLEPVEYRFEIEAPEEVFQDLKQEGQTSKEQVLRNVEKKLEPGSDVEEVVRSEVSEYTNTTLKAANLAGNVKEWLKEREVIEGNNIDGYKVVE